MLKIDVAKTLFPKNTIMLTISGSLREQKLSRCLSHIALNRTISAWLDIPLTPTDQPHETFTRQKCTNSGCAYMSQCGQGCLAFIFMVGFRFNTDGSTPRVWEFLIALHNTQMPSLFPRVVFPEQGKLLPCLEPLCNHSGHAIQLLRQTCGSCIRCRSRHVRP